MTEQEKIQEIERLLLDIMSERTGKFNWYKSHIGLAIDSMLKIVKTLR